MVVPDASSPTRRRWLLPATVILAIGVVGGVFVASRAGTSSPPLAGDPPVVAGRQLWGSCAAGFYARRGDTVVLTSSAHCASEGTTAYAPDGRTVRGVFGPPAVLDPCEHAATHTCRPSDMNYLVVAPDQIPWGRLNVVDLGDGEPRVIAGGTRPLSCTDVAFGDGVEINGRDIYRSGMVTEIGENLHDPTSDGDFFPCMIVAADIEVGVGDSGGAVLVRGIPAGVTSRSFAGALGFTPLAEGLEALGLALCTAPDCGLDAPP